MGARIAIGLSGTGGAGGGRGVRRTARRRSRAPGCWRSPVPDRLHAGWLAALRARRGGDRAARVAYRARAGAAGAGGRPGDGAGRPSGDACLAGCGARPACGAARAGSLRPERRHPGSVSRVRHRSGRHPRCLRAGAADIRHEDDAAVLPDRRPAVRYRHRVRCACGRRDRPDQRSAEGVPEPRHADRDRRARCARPTCCARRGPMA